MESILCATSDPTLIWSKLYHNDQKKQTIKSFTDSIKKKDLSLLTVGDCKTVSYVTVKNFLNF